MELLSDLIDADVISRVEYKVQFYTSDVDKAGLYANVAFLLFEGLHQSAKQHICNHQHGLKIYSITKELAKQTTLSSMAWNPKDHRPIIVQYQPLQNCLGDSAEMTYKLTVVTGKRPFAGANARVYFTLFGDLGNTGRSSVVQSPGHFSRGSKDVFLTVASELGSIQTLRVGHNGLGIFPRWYLNHVDVQTHNSGERWHFECGDWISPPSTRVATTDGDFPVFTCTCISPWKESRLERDYFPTPNCQE